MRDAPAFFSEDNFPRKKGLLITALSLSASRSVASRVPVVVKVNIRILVPEKNKTLRDEQGNYAGQGTARRTYYMLHTSGCHFEALKALGEIEPIDGWTVQEVRVHMPWKSGVGSTLC